MGRTASFPDFTPTAGVFVRWCAEHHGGRVFVILGDERLTYADAERRSALLARGMLASGVGKGTRVGLLAPNSPDWVIAWLAAARIGAVVAMGNTYAKAGGLRRMLLDSDAALLLCVPSYLGNDYLGRLEEALPSLVSTTDPELVVTDAPYLRRVCTFGATGRGWARPIGTLLEAAPEVSEELLAAVEAQVAPADPMVIVYSSGSTAAPKGAVHSQRAVIAHPHNLAQFRDLASDDVCYTPMPLFWVGGLSWTLVAAMHAGATLVFEDRFEPGATLELIERERVTQVLGWPHMAKALMEHPSFGERDLSSVRGGNLAMLKPAADGFDAAPKANSLGMTETLGPHTIEAKADALPPGKEGSFGRPVPGVEHRIVDPITGEDCPVGVDGELWLRGYSLMLSVNKVDRADTFTPDGWYRTGDGGHFDTDGHFYYRGRLGEVIKSSGMNVTPRDVEIELESLDGVALAFVTGIDGGSRGQDVVAAVALAPDAPAGRTEDEIRAELKARVANYLVPRHVEVFASTEELPWLDSGKVDRRALTQVLIDHFGESRAESGSDST